MSFIRNCIGYVPWFIRQLKTVEIDFFHESLDVPVKIMLAVAALGLISLMVKIFTDWSNIAFWVAMLPSLAILFGFLVIFVALIVEGFKEFKREKEKLFDTIKNS